MTGGVPSSSGSSMGGAASIAGFEVSTRDGRAALLSGIRESTLTPIEKAEARDLLFAYSHAGNEAIGSLLSVLIDKAGIVAPPAAAPVAETLAPSTPPVPPPAPATPAPAAPPEPAPAPSAPVPPSLVPEPTPETSASAAPAESAIPAPSAFVPEVSAVPVAETPPAAPEPNQATPAAEPVAPQNDHLARIKEIKRIVNEKVGNPVALIDANNQVGREYMDALLEAMKQVSGADQGGSIAAMGRLENAYSAVEKMLAEGGVSATPTAPAASKVAPADPVAVPEPVAAPTPEVSAEASSTPPEPAAVLSPAELAAAAPAPDPAPEKVDPVPSVVDTPAPQAPEIAAAPEPAPATPSATPAVPEAEVAPAADTTQSLTETPAVPADNVLDQPVTPENSVSAAELNTPEITAGLNQLLSEWAIFKTSGFLGTGPSGADHPLYATMKDLPMTSVVTGRFEGGSPEIKQSVSDYMKGWKYEQDVDYTQAETFEHYLRRVVKKILENARAKAASASQADPQTA